MKDIDLEGATQMLRNARDFNDVADIFNLAFSITPAYVETFSKFEKLATDIREGNGVFSKEEYALNCVDFYEQIQSVGYPLPTELMASDAETEAMVELAMKLNSEPQEVTKILHEIGKAEVDRIEPDIAPKCKKFVEKDNALKDEMEKRNIKPSNLFFRATNNEICKLIADSPFLSTLQSAKVKIQEEIDAISDERDKSTDEKYKYNLSSSIFTLYVQSKEITKRLIKSKEYRKICSIAEKTAQKTVVELLPDEIKPQYQELLQQKEELYGKVITALLENSPITEEEAKDWVEHNVSFDKTALRRLNSSDTYYPPEDIKADVAELYRLVGGRLGKVEFGAERGAVNRAFARGKHFINVRRNFNKKSLFHECAHLMEEYDSVSHDACLGFLKKRAKGTPVSLSRLMGKGFRRDEVAFPDDFFSPYVGKDYGGRATEVLSMGLEMLSSPQDLMELAIKDPEHFNLLIGFCKTKRPFVMNQIMADSPK